LGTANFNEIMEEMGPCKLAFNCVGGAVATDMARSLASGGTMVTYGEMSNQVLSLPMDLVASKQLQLKGFSINAWMATHSYTEKQHMIGAVTSLIREKQLTFFYEMHDFDDFNHALKESYEPYRLRKVVLNMDYGNRFAEHDALDQENDYIHFQYPPN
jgi:NADPH:quinone reductase-like Zn-dependent oxidoreductase